MRKGREQPNPEKIKQVEELKRMIGDYAVVGMLDMHKMPASALQKMRFKLADKVVIKISKKNIIVRALEQIEQKKKLLGHISIQPGFILSNTNSFKLYKLLQKEKSPAAAKPGDIAVSDIMVPAGPTDLMPGPAISALTKVKIPAKVEGGKIAVMNDAVVCKAGEKISADLASALSMLKLEPMKVGLNLEAVWEDGIIYTKDILAVDEEKVLSDLILGYQQALNLSVNACYPTKDNIELMIGKAFREAKSLSLEAGIISKEIIGELLAKAVLDAKALEEKIPETPKEEVKEELNMEEKKEEVNKENTNQ